jgi:hypothetical protein
MIAARLSAVWQVAGVAGAALCCYMVSQSVAAERAALLRVEKRIADTEDDIRRLNTEIGARARMVQLQRWNREVLALQAPRPKQFVADGVQLASLYGRRGQAALPLDPAITGQVAADRVAFAPTMPSAAPLPQPAPAIPRVEPAQPMLHTANYLRPGLGLIAGAVPPLRQASLTRSPAPAQIAPVLATKPAAPERGRPDKDAVKAATPLKVAKVETPAPKRKKADASEAKTSLLPADIGALAAAESRTRR